MRRSRRLSDDAFITAQSHDPDRCDDPRFDHLPGPAHGDRPGAGCPGHHAGRAPQAGAAQVRSRPARRHAPGAGTRHQRQEGGRSGGGDRTRADGAAQAHRRVRRQRAADPEGRQRPDRGRTAGPDRSRARQEGGREPGVPRIPLDRQDRWLRGRDSIDGQGARAPRRQEHRRGTESQRRGRTPHRRLCQGSGRYGWCFDPRGTDPRAVGRRLVADARGIRGTGDGLSAGRLAAVRSGGPASLAPRRRAQVVASADVDRHPAGAVALRPVRQGDRRRWASHRRGRADRSTLPATHGVVHAGSRRWPGLRRRDRSSRRRLHGDPAER